MIIDDVYKCINSNSKEMKEYCECEILDWIKGKNLPNKSLDGETKRKSVLDLTIKELDSVVTILNSFKPEDIEDIYEIDYVDKDEFLVKLEDGDFDEYIINGVCIDTVETVLSVIEINNRYTALVNEDYTTREDIQMSTLLFDEYYDSPYDVIERIAKDSTMLRLFFSYALYCDYIIDHN